MLFFKKGFMYKKYIAKLLSLPTTIVAKGLFQFILVDKDEE